MDFVMSKDGTKIAFDRLGEGPPVILVSGKSVDLAGQTHDVAPDAIAPVLAEFSGA